MAVHVRTVSTIVIMFAARKDGQPVLSRAELPESLEAAFKNTVEISAFHRLIESGRVTGLPGNFELHKMEPLDGYMPDKCGPSYVMVVSLGSDPRRDEVSTIIGQLVEYLGQRPGLPRHVQFMPSYSEPLNQELEQHWFSLPNYGGLQPLVRWPEYVYSEVVAA